MKLCIRDVAQARGWTISRLHSQIDRRLRHMDRANVKAGEPVSVMTIRRYWYGTRNGKQAGPAIDTVSLPILAAIADEVGVHWSQLFEP